MSHRIAQLADRMSARLRSPGSSHAHDGPLPNVRRRPSVQPILPVDDMSAATDFYRRLGFDVESFDPGYSWVRHCGWEYLHLRLVETVAGNSASAYVHVDDADAWHAAMSSASAGTVPLDCPADRPWGMREFEFTDPSDNVVRIGHNL